MKPKTDAQILKKYKSARSTIPIEVGKTQLSNKLIDFVEELTLLLLKVPDAYRPLAHVHHEITHDDWHTEHHFRVTYDKPESDAELLARVKKLQDQALQATEKEKETYVKLKKKFEGIDVDISTVRKYARKTHKSKV